jgi:hypothetical protein
MQLLLAPLAEHTGSTHQASSAQLPCQLQRLAAHASRGTLDIQWTFRAWTAVNNGAV